MQAGCADPGQPLQARDAANDGRVSGCKLQIVTTVKCITVLLIDVRLAVRILVDTSLSVLPLCQNNSLKEEALMSRGTVTAEGDHRREFHEFMRSDHESAGLVPNATHLIAFTPLTSVVAKASFAMTVLQRVALDNLESAQGGAR